MKVNVLVGVFEGVDVKGFVVVGCGVREGVNVDVTVEVKVCEGVTEAVGV